MASPIAAVAACASAFPFGPGFEWIHKDRSREVISVVSPLTGRERRECAHLCQGGRWSSVHAPTTYAGMRHVGLHCDCNDPQPAAAAGEEIFHRPAEKPKPCKMTDSRVDLVRRGCASRSSLQKGRRLWERSGLLDQHAAAQRSVGTVRSPIPILLTHTFEAILVKSTLLISLHSAFQ